MRHQFIEEDIPSFEVAASAHEMKAYGLETLLRELGGVVATTAVDEVVGFVDDENAVVVVALLLVRLEGHIRIEDIVVVADDDVRLFDQLQRHFERADLA
jgi:hypothetical protein